MFACAIAATGVCVEGKGTVMLIGDVCKRDVVCAPRETTVRAAANLMRQHHVGDVVVIDRADAERMPIGIVTDRDIVVEVVAQGLDASLLTLGDMLSWGELVTVQESDTYAHTIRLMHAKGIRRVPVINAAGVLVGIISIDDMLPRAAKELSELAELGERGRQREVQARI
jgi:CBS domain-containing protein